MKFDQKHRPASLNEVVFANAEVKLVLEEYANNSRDKHLMLYGPKGTGKSMSAQLVMAQRMGAIVQSGLGGAYNAKAYQMQHDTFDPLLTQWNWQLSMGAYTGCSVIDELDQFTLPMQHKLRAFIDRYEMGFVIATTNNLHLVDGPLKDRFRPVLVDYPSVAQWVPRVVSVLNAEGIPITAAQAQTLLTGFKGTGRSLNDWMEDYVFRLQRMMNKLTTTPTASTPCAITKAVEGK
jgi:ATPase family associated with various cellular activities (AAA)